MVFTKEQQALIKDGEEKGKTLGEWITSALKISKQKVTPKRHWYIQSPPGLGKTYSLRKAIMVSKTKVNMIQGESSIAAIARLMAYAVHVGEPTAKKPLFFCVDDSDGLFTNSTSIAVMQGALDEERNIFAYEKDMTGQIIAYRDDKATATTKLVADALERFQTPGGVGINIPLDHCNFIILSNKALCSERDARDRPKFMREASIRSRVTYRPLPLTGMQYWGWTASVLLKENILGAEFELSLKNKMILLNWMYHNWESLPNRDLRGVKEYVGEMINHPKDYQKRLDLRLEECAA